MKERYKIIVGEPADVVEKVTPLLDAGWFLVGPAMPDSTETKTIVCQTLVLSHNDAV